MPIAFLIIHWQAVAAYPFAEEIDKANASTSVFVPKTALVKKTISHYGLMIFFIVENMIFPRSEPLISEQTGF